MVNNSTNTKKKNNHISPQTIDHRKTMTYGIRNPDPDLGQEQNCGRVKGMVMVNEISILTSDNWIK